MLLHYLKIAIRNLAKQRVLASINVLGLSIGLACFSLFLLYAVNEFGFDRFHKNAANIYRINLWREAMNGDKPGGSSYMPMPLGPAMKQDFPDVENYVRIKEAGEESFVRADDKVSRVKVTFADPQFFSVFSFKLLAGTPAAALQKPGNIVLTRESALQLFGKTDVVGKIVEIKVEDDFTPFTISAVAENIPPNSSIQFDVLASFDYFTSIKWGKASVNNWHRSGYQTYLQLLPGSKLMNEPAKLLKFHHTYYPDQEAQLIKSGLWNGKGPAPFTYRLQPLRDMHTDTQVNGGAVSSINPKNIWILLGIAAGVLLIACINFTTLAIGRSAGRAKEVGVRKVIGGGKKQLILQFLTESLLLSLFSAVLGILLAQLLLPYFNRLSARELNFSFSNYPEMFWLLAVVILMVGLLAGSYPAFILSSFRPVEVLKSRIRLGGSNIFTRSLVTFQFVLSLGLVISTLVILHQLTFMRSQNPGFNKENILVVDAEGTDSKHIYPLFRQALAAHPEITGVAGSELGLGEGTGWSMSGFEYNGKHKEMYEYFVDADYLPVMGIRLIAGRNFSSAIASDTVSSVILNESAVKDFGWTPENAIGQQLKGYSENLTPVIIGVVKDFNFRPLSEKVPPQMFHAFHDYTSYKYFVRIKPGNPAPALDVLKKAWTSVVPVLPFRYTFLDEDIDNFYKSEARWSGIVGWAGGISIFLACLGLFGLAALAAVNRSKEIGIRKVLGASVTGIVGLLSKDFLKLVILAMAIASPLAWYFMNAWLQDYAYRVTIGWLVFAVTGIMAVVIALITIGFQAVKAALANPVESLRSE
jgi:putative ABC transport system permease protein